ncbi:uncharacterized protein MELLADRAFT_102899 [Melampsora larici-populina 98AG31]|uniref:Uncharacterized protein n=1 Tax=Melampsora larici-populina (strain 98AG31 / pathotype 3-4-7) TaxID=747676 RepID=F4R9R7_MELLP|nr:uncharacterized protein MELLADRAFT_102899 [Melampsora larici-populina 98AG31]EGG11027.1 hypothetical protein MELLADRAFT_102899 [Melampsora larici-populina 98AG31]
MGFRVEKSNKSFLPQLRDHRRRLAARQHSERQEASRRRIQEQVEERNRRAASRTPNLALPLPTLANNQRLMNDIDGDEISSQNSTESIIPSESASRKKTLSSISFKKMTVQTPGGSGSSSNNAGANPSGTGQNGENSQSFRSDLIEKDSYPGGVGASARSQPPPSTINGLANPAPPTSSNNGVSGQLAPPASSATVPTSTPTPQVVEKAAAPIQVQPSTAEAEQTQVLSKKDKKLAKKAAKKEEKRVEKKAAKEAKKAKKLGKEEKKLTGKIVTEAEKGKKKNQSPRS